MAYNGYLRDNVETFNSFASSYVDFTSSLITSTFEALLDTTLKQVEAYTDMVSTMSKDLTTYINETVDEVHDEQVLQYLEMLPLQQAGVLPEGNTLGLDYKDVTGNVTEGRRLIQLDANGADVTPQGAGFVKGIGDAITGVLPGGGLIGNAVKSINNAVKLPDSTGTNFTTPTDLQNATGINELNGLIFKAVAQRIASNKYAMLENMVRLGFMRLVIDNGLIETRLNMSFKEVDKYSKKQVDKVKNRNKNKTVVKQRPSLHSFLFNNRNKMRSKSKHVHIEVHKTKEKEQTKNVGQVQTSALVRIQFSTDYQPLANQ